jgi:IS30 family transposase
MRGRVLTVDEREIVSRELAAGATGRGIARRLGRHHSVVNREIQRNGGAAVYRAMAAQRRAEAHRGRPKPHRLVADRRLHDEVNAGLARKWSPRQISRRLRDDFAGDHTMRVSHETIYRCLYLQAKGQLRTDLALALRQGRAARVPRTRPSVARGTIPRMVNISERPAEAADRAVPGFWEGDLIIGKGGKSQIATLVERSTRFVMLVRIPYDRTAERVAIQLSLKMQTLPDFLRKSVTWDQGKEMAAHEKFTLATGMPVYFCDPHSPWQRGSNENTNGLLRQYFPKGTDLSGYSQADLDAVAQELNGRPRQTLNWRKPVEAFNDLLVQALAH